MNYLKPMQSQCGSLYVVRVQRLFPLLWHWYNDVVGHIHLFQGKRPPWEHSNSRFGRATIGKNSIEAIWWEKGVLPAQSNTVREHCVLRLQWCMLHGFCVKVSYCWGGDLHVFVHLSSSAPNRGKLVQASISEGWTKGHYQAESPMLTATNLAVSCCRWFRCGASGAEREFSELLFISVVKDL